MLTLGYSLQLLSQNKHCNSLWAVVTICTVCFNIKQLDISFVRSFFGVHLIPRL
jgi:hypothetical protein